MAGPRLYNGSGFQIFFDTWIGHPQLPRWKNDSVTRLGSGSASTQVTNRTSGMQQSVANIVVPDIATVNANISYLINATQLGRISFEGYDGFVVNNLIIKDVSYNYTKGSYSAGTTSAGDPPVTSSLCYPYKLLFNISYIVDITD